MADFLIPARDADDWQRLLAEPDKHWRTGYSAKALAHCCQAARDFPPSVRTVFNASPFDLFDNITMLLAIPEHRVPLPGRGKASQTDLFVLAKSGDDLVSVTVEGKVAESFDVLVSEWLFRPTSPRIEEQGAAGVREPGPTLEDTPAKWYDRRPCLPCPRPATRQAERSKG